MLSTDNVGKKSIQQRELRGSISGPGGMGGGAGANAAAPQSVTGTTSGMSQNGGNRKNYDRYERDIMEGFVQYNSTASIRKIQNDIFYFDPIVGTVVETRSNLPFSNFELSGCESKERRLKYTASVNAMQIRSMIPRISREKMVEGYHISYMNFDDEEKRFKSIIPHNPEYCGITPIPVFGRDPLIDVTYPEHIIAAAKSNDPDMQAELAEYAEDLVDMIRDKKTRLDPRYTLYIARTPFTWSPYGISYLRRLIPIWLYEKSLARGTIDLSGRRQKALLHLIMGDEEWLPTNEQLTQITQLFIDADNDPIGAMVATRPGIETNEVRPGSDHWRWDESWDSFTTMKLKSLGVPESIFGDFSVQAAESTLSSFLEDMINEREEFTQRIFYNKMFLIIATENDFKLTNKQRELTASDKMIQQFRDSHDYISYNSQHVMLGANETIDPALYDLPQVRWEKSLRIVSNDTLFNNLGVLAERGMPAPLRMQAALLGMSAEDMFAGLAQDVEDRKIIADYQKKLPKSAALPGAEGGDDDGGGGEGADMFMESQDKWSKLIGSNPGARIKNRSFDSIEQRDPATGKVLSRKGRIHKINRENSIIIEAAERIRSNQKPDTIDSSRKTISYPIRRKL